MTKHKFFYFLFSFIFIFSMFSISALTQLQAIPDVTLDNIGPTNSLANFTIFFRDLMPNLQEDSVYIAFTLPNGSAYSIRADGDSFTNTSAFAVWVDDNPGTLDVIFQANPGALLLNLPINVFASELNQSTSIPQDTFLLSIYDDVPQQIASIGSFTLRSYQTITIPLSSWFLPGTYNRADLILIGPDQEALTTLDGQPASFINNTIEFSLVPTLQSTPTMPYGDINLVVRSLNGTLPVTNYVYNLTLNVQQYPKYFPYNNDYAGIRLWSNSSLSQTGFQQISFTFVPSNASVPDVVVGQGNSNTGSGMFSKIASGFSGIFPDKSNLSWKSRFSYVLITMFSLAIVVFFAFLFTGRGEVPKAAVYVVGLLEVMLVAFFIGIGYISVGVLIVLVIVALLIVVLKRG